MPSRNPDDLHPAAKSALIKLNGACASAGITLKVICTYRSGDEQTKLYQQGRTTAGRIVTHANAGQSPHNCKTGETPASRAFDVMLYQGKKIVGTITKADLEIWHKVGAVSSDFGLKWGGNFTGGFKDYAHFELINWRNYA